MKYRIIADSSLDFNDELEKRVELTQIPFKLYIDEEEIVDDKKLDVNNFIDKMINSSALPRTACPSPNDFKEMFENEDNIFVITISSKLSGTHNSATLAKNLELENGEKNIHVFDSKSASGGLSLIALKIDECIKKGLSFKEVVESVEKYINEMETFFVSESLNNLIKNGRIPSWKGKLAMALKIRPIMYADDGEIISYDKARGSNKAFEKLAVIVSEKISNASERTCVISHVNNLDRAKKLKSRLEELSNFKEIVIVATHGLTSLYCDNQGIIIAF